MGQIQSKMLLSLAPLCLFVEGSTAPHTDSDEECFFLQMAVKSAILGWGQFSLKFDKITPYCFMSR